MTPNYNFKIKSGNSGTISNPNGIEIIVVDSNDNPIDFTGWDVYFFAGYKGNPSVIKSTIEGDVLLDHENGHITVPITVEDSRRFPSNSNIIYEIEKRSGLEQRIVVEGKIEIVGGINGD